MSELVGEAFIRITADTDVMRRALARQMKAAGKNDAGEYVRSFSNEVKSSAGKDIKKAQNTLARALADPKVFDEQVKHFGSVEKASKSWQKTLRDLSRQHKIATGDYQIFKGAILDWERTAIAARDAQKKLTKEHEEALVINRRLTDEWAAHRIELERNRKAAAALQKQEEVLARLRQRENDRKHGIRRDVDGKIIGRASALGRSLDRIDYRMDRIGDKIARGFGKGSRNDFLNIVGSMAGGMFRLATRVVSFPLRILGSVTDGIAAFGETWKETGSLFKSLGAGGGALFKGFASAIPALLAATGALFLFAKVIPGAVAGLSLLAGAITAVASAVSFGIIGALLAAAPALAGLIAGLGGVAVAFVSFFGDKKKKQLVADFMKPIKDLGKRFKPEVEEFLKGFGGGLKGVFADLTPAVDAFFTSWKKNMNDASTRKGLSNFSDSMGRIATTFNTAIPQLLSGLIGFFQPILPYAEKLATYLGDAMKTFDDWANGVPGQNAIASFMSRAWTEAKKVWDILGDVKDLIVTIFDLSEPTGGGILDGIHGKLQDIIGWLKDPANKGKIDEWFANAGTMAVDVGKLAGSIGEIIRNFNSPEGQKNAKGLMDAIVSIGNAAAKVSATADAIAKIFEWLGKIVNFGSPEGANGHGWLHNMIWGEDKPLPKPPVFKPQSVPTVDPKVALAGRKDLVEKYRVTISPQTTLAKEQLKAIEDYQFKDKTIPIKGNEELWALMRDTAAAYVFTPKQIPVKGNTAEWDKTKGTAQAFVFDSKEIAIKANTTDLRDAIASAKRYLATLPSSHTIRIAGVNGQGGITLAAGGVFDKATAATIGEAGAEAVVPLNRPLSQVDPAVRQLSAIAQGMSMPKGLPAANSGPRVNFSEGAIQVNLPTGDPKQAAEAVLDRLVAYIG